MTETGIDEAIEFSLVNDLREIALAAERIEAFCSDTACRRR